MIKIITYLLFITALFITIELNASPQEVIKQCEGCHGKQGNSKKQDIPSIASFSVVYSEDVMADFKSGKRQGKRVKATPSSPETNMNEIAKKVNPNDLKAAYTYFSKQAFIPARQPSVPALADKGKKVYVKRCKKCHGDNGNDPEDDAAILKGQWLTYLKAQMKEFQSGSRPIPKKMKKQLDKLKPHQMEELMHFFAQP